VIIEAEAVEDVALRCVRNPASGPASVARSVLRDYISRNLPAFLAANPLLRLQIMITNRRVDLIEEGVDVAIRARERSTPTRLQVKKSA